jgi:hypothetical protein
MGTLKQYWRKWREEHPGVNGAITKRWRKANPEKAREACRKWRRANPEKSRAHSNVNSMIRRGKLVSQPCSICGKKAHAHHADYSKPTEITWLCVRHHKRLHRQPI